MRPNAANARGPTGLVETVGVTKSQALRAAADLRLVRGNVHAQTVQALR